jgi:hypothetical protein
MLEVKLCDRLLTVCPNVYPGAAPVGYKRPCVIYNRISTDPTRNLDDDDETATVTFQIDVYSALQTEALQLSANIRANMKAWQDPDIECVAYTSRQSMIDNTTEVQLFREMTFFELFAND